MSLTANTFDVAIIGAGPAGCATALALRRLGRSCLVVERSHPTQVRIGETLPPAARRPLAALGAWDSFLAAAHLPSVAIRSTWGSAETRERDFIFDPYGNGWHLDRGRFDAMLAEQAQAAGADLRRPARLLRASADTPGAWTLHVATGAACDVFRSRFVVDATGRAASFARQQGATRTAHDHLIGVVARYRPTTSQAVEAGFMLLEATRGGWWYGAPLPDARLVMTLMTDHDLHARGVREFEASLMQTEHAARRVQGFALEGRPRPTPAHSACLAPVCGAQWLAVGDAAVSCDPLSGQGIMKALDMGMLAGRTISSHLAGDATAMRDYQAKVRSDFERYLAMRDAYYSSETRWADSPFWRRRLFARQPLREQGHIAPAKNW
ncbi:NAD(P)/FAD-dependent oxidoreductase [Piscinibacter sp.]|jgi:flavin-dependent dehydrogenase|uniref:NAD(P)/FAD-dependent oxidoreductase n=1 Tax=Piscinibacter sp. TaxID=1903157 RepID=UPI00355A7A82